VPPPQGENRCHGGCNVGRQPLDRSVLDWEVAGRPQARCQASHHQPPSREPSPGRNPAQLFEELMSHIPAMRLAATGLEPTVLEMDEAQRALFRATATDWEIKNSRIIAIGGMTPVVDDANAVLAYLKAYSSSGVYHLDCFDVNGGNIFATTTGERPLEDSIGNEILATIVTLGGAVAVRAIARGVLSSAASSLGNALTRITVVAARGISAEAEESVLLALRSIRARAIVRSFVRRGVKVVVNIGGEAGPEELAKYGEQIALNHQVRMSIAKRFIPNLVKEPGENIGLVFRENTIDLVVSRKLDASIDVERIAQGAFRVLRSGGRLEMRIYTNHPEFGNQFVQALIRAGFERNSIQNLGNTLFMAVKP
jgi:hypothetical protein